MRDGRIERVELLNLNLSGHIYDYLIWEHPGSFSLRPVHLCSSLQLLPPAAARRRSPSHGASSPPDASMPPKFAQEKAQRERTRDPNVPIQPRVLTAAELPYRLPHAILPRPTFQQYSKASSATATPPPSASNYNSKSAVSLCCNSAVVSN